MGTQGIDAVVVETHNWGKAAKFWQSLGFKLEFETDHNSGKLTCGDGPYVFVVEVPESQTPRMQCVLKVSDEDSVDDSLDVVAPFEETHYGTTEMTVRDTDGRLWTLQRA
ncbi:VOC family protein [Amycolatopsis sp. GM8]|uniref:VOC family protein n=1 Tax=Amycolatopsis sp. GM8 TaxID=2896530 RepID=UPI001F44F0A9|nr:VOC family protein [Amycolatopsis sp. GM8]